MNMISLVIPAYNEAGIIASTVRAADGFLRSLGREYELIVVDDGSTDGTGDEVRALELDRVRVVGYVPNKGKGHAVRTGMMNARGDIIFTTDADLAYGLDPIAGMVKLMEREHADAVIGSRRLKPGGYGKYPPLRRAASATFNVLTSLLSGLRWDTQCGLKGFTRAAARDVFSRCEAERFAYDVEVLLWAKELGYNVLEYCASIINHRASKINVATDSFRMLRDIVRIRAAFEVKSGKKPGIRAYIPPFLLIFSLLILRYAYYGFKYFPQLDDYIQYYNYRAIYPCFSQCVNSMSLLASRPLAGICDYFIWSGLWNHMFITVIILSAMYSAALCILHSVFSRYFRVGGWFYLICALLPFTFEGLYWVSASARIIPGLFSAAVCALLFTRWCDSGKKVLLPFYILAQLAAFGFYEQTLVFCAALTVLIGIMERSRPWRAVWACTVALCLGAYVAVTHIFSGSGVYASRVEFYLPWQENYSMTLESLLKQIRQVFIYGNVKVLAIGFRRGISQIAADGAFIWLLISVVLCALFFFIAKRRNGDGKKPWRALVFGLLLSLAPLVPYFVIKEPWFSMRAAITSLPGLALIADTLIRLIFGKHVRACAAVAAALAMCCLISSASEIHDYKQTYDYDQAAGHAICAAISDSPGKHSFGVLGLKKVAVDTQNYLYHEHVHGVTESGWALTGMLRCLASDESIPFVTPILDGGDISSYDVILKYDAKSGLVTEVK